MFLFAIVAIVATFENSSFKTDDGNLDDCVALTSVDCVM